MIGSLVWLMMRIPRPKKDMERGRAEMTQLKLSMFGVSVIVLSFEYLLHKFM